MAKKSDNEIFLTLGILALAYFGVINPLLKKIGIKKTEEEKQEDVNIKEAETGGASSNPFDPNFWKSGPERLLLTTAEVTKRADAIWNCSAPNYFYQDNEACIMGAITTLKTQTQVSYLSDFFQKKYQVSLIKFLKTGRTSAPWAGLSDSELNEVIANVKNKPKYK